MNLVDYTIRIQYCNNISNGEISICSNKLNIFFGHNGTGKSTIAKAIYLASQGKQLTELAPYGNVSDDKKPYIEGIPTGNVLVFNEDYVNQFVFQPDTLIKDTFEVLIRSREYDDAKNNIDKALSNIKTTITERQEIIWLQEQVSLLLDALKLTKDNKISKRGGAKGILQGKGAYFNPPEKLNDFKPFFEKDTVTNWAAWRLNGYENFGQKGFCPYCSKVEDEKTKIINEVFLDSFDKASVETAVKIIKALEGLKPYLSDEKVSELISLFGTKNDLEALETQLAKLCAEAKYLYEKLTTIISFNGFSVDRENIKYLEELLDKMKINLNEINTFFVSELTNSEIKNINDKIENLLREVGVLKGEIGKINKYIQEKIKERKDDINEFLTIAGFRYAFDVEVIDEDKARALLKFRLPDGKHKDVQSPRNQLSWGEKNAFALILFMFDAISKNAELVILDDPISSFDNNKKYAIINRLFKTGDKKNSLYQRTVLMLTHDFEPVIDYIQVGAGRQDPTSVCATYFENINGCLCCTPIRKNIDMMSSMVLLKELASDESIDIAARISCLRKFIEYQYRNPRDESDAYNILSSLIHGRIEPTYDNDGKIKLSDTQISNGISFINQYITNFDYNNIYTQCKPELLLDRYLLERIPFIKMQILRVYIERNIEARKRLQKNNDALRKYIDEACHIENDYIYSLDVRRFNIVPGYYIEEADRFVLNEKQILNKE